MNREKDKGRSLLGDDILPKLLFVPDNLCHAHEMGNCDQFVDQWLADGHMLPALLEQDATEAETAAVERQSDEASHEHTAGLAAPLTPKVLRSCSIITSTR